MMNFNEAIFYQIYALSFGGKNSADSKNTANGQNSVDRQNSASNIQTSDFCSRVKEWIPHIKKLNANAIYFNPIFQSDNHGYDTQDYYTLDHRLGTNDDFAELCRTLHEEGISVMLDGVFNHVGRGFWAFRDVQQNKQNSAYKDWFYIDWGNENNRRDSNYGDGFWYEGWEGCFDLVKLNLKNPAVREHLFGAIRFWKQKFNIDAVRLDVAYCLDRDFLTELHALCKELGIFVLGETIHSESMRMVNDGLLDSATNYEVYKGLHSSLNSRNMFEIEYSLNRLFGKGGIYEQKVQTNPLFNFVDNHDVSRIASLLNDKNFLPLIYGLLFALPGTPCIYYGSEWQTEGKKEDGDENLRQNFERPYWNSLTDFIGCLSWVRKNSNALKYGKYEKVFLSNYQFVFKREHTDPFTGKTSRALIAVNLGGSEYYANCGLTGEWKNLFTGEKQKMEKFLRLPPVSIMMFEQ